MTKSAGTDTTLKRSAGYVIGISILPIGTLGFLAGFASPYWHFSRRVDGGTRVHGVWVVCDQESGTLSNCVDNVVRAEDWMRGIQFLLSAALLLLMLGCILAILTNFTKKPGYRRLLEGCAGFGSVFAMFGSLGYLFFTLSPPSGDSDPLTFTWGFGINLAGGVVSVLAAVLIAACRKPSCVKQNNRQQQSKGKKQSKENKPRQPTLSKGANSTRLTTKSQKSRRMGHPGHRDTIQDKKTWLLPAEKYWMSNV